MGQSPTVEVGTTGLWRETGHVDGGRAAEGCRGSAPGGAARHLGPAATGAHVGPERLEGRPEVDHATRLKIVGHAEIQLTQPALRPRNGLYLALKLFVGIIRIMLIHYISYETICPWRLYTKAAAMTASPRPNNHPPYIIHINCRMEILTKNVSCANLQKISDNKTKPKENIFNKNKLVTIVPRELASMPCGLLTDSA